MVLKSCECVKSCFDDASGDTHCRQHSVDIAWIRTAAPGNDDFHLLCSLQHPVF
jgi:hypothetical protein